MSVVVVVGVLVLTLFIDSGCIGTEHGTFRSCLLSDLPVSVFSDIMLLNEKVVVFWF